MEQNNISKFLKYAIGEIILVMVGILLALQVNNWNLNRLEEIKLNTYRSNLITEINTDLKNINIHIENTQYNKNAIMDYISYYNSVDLDITALINKLNNLSYFLEDFETSIYTINDLLSTGNISIFPEEEKKAIYALKNSLEKINAVEKSSQDDVQDRWDIFYSNVDELYEYGYSSKQHLSVEDWRYNINSEEFRMQNNVFAIVLWLYNKQLNDLFPTLQGALNSALNIIEPNMSTND